MGAFSPSVFRAGVDNAASLGTASIRWTLVYAASSTINTSDEREKTWRGAPTAAELAAAKRIVAELGFFQWNEAIAEKGAATARHHLDRKRVGGGKGG